MKTITASLFFLTLVAAYSTQTLAEQAGAEATSTKPIDCSAAAEHIRALNAEKVRTSQEVEGGAESIIPDYAVAPLFAGTGQDRFAVETGEYNKKLDAKIAEIKQQCNLN